MMWNKNGATFPFWSISKDEDLFSIPRPQTPPPPPPFDFNECNATFEWQDELSLEGSNTTIDVTPLATSYMAYDPLYWPLSDLGASFPSQTLPQEFEATPVDMFSSNMESVGNGFQGSIDLFDQEMKLEESMGDVVEQALPQVEKKNKRRPRTSSSQGVISINNSKTSLSREEISEYFYMPITVAAKELNVGLTLLKKRCRELGIRRWPHRKLKSLQTLIKNVQAMGCEDGDMNTKKVREAIELLAYEQRLMEEKPDLQLQDKTKRLRQACFKDNYKRRKLMTRISAIDSSECTASSTNSDGGGSIGFY